MTLLPDDSTLTEAGLAPAAAGRVLLIACGALAHEVLAIKRSGGWDHLDLQCLPANLHLWPDRIPDAVSAAVAAALEQGWSWAQIAQALGVSKQAAHKRLSPHMPQAPQRPRS